MNGSKIAVFGGTGQTGRALVAALSARHVEGRALARLDLTAGAAALDGCDVAYLIAPNMHLNEPDLISDFLRLIAEAGIDRVIYHSVTAPFAPAMKHHYGKAVSEDLIRRSGLNWTILQPCAYVQNFLGDMRAGLIRVPFRTDAPFGLVDLNDVGAAGAVACTDSAHVGATYELGGPAIVTIDDLAAAATRVSGHKVDAVTESVDEWVARAATGMSAEMCERFVDMWNYYDSHGLLTGGAPLEAILGRPGRAIENVVADHM